jgi:hypothetical protein
MSKNDWGQDCCKPVPVADYTGKGIGPRLYLRHMGPRCLGHTQTITFTELKRGRVAAS